MRNLFTLLIALFLCTSLNAQMRMAEPSLVHVKGKMFVELSTAYNGHGVWAMGEYGYFFNSWFIGKAGLSYERLGMEFSYVNRFGLELTAMATVYRFMNDLFVHVRASAMLGVETSKNEVFGSYSNFILSESLGLGVEYLLPYRFSVSAFYDQKMFELTEMGRFGYRVGLGVGYHF